MPTYSQHSCMRIPYLLIVHGYTYIYIYIYIQKALRQTYMKYQLIQHHYKRNVNSSSNFNQRTLSACISFYTHVNNTEIMDLDFSVSLCEYYGRRLTMGDDITVKLMR